MAELIIVVIFAIMGLSAHAAKKHKWIEWFIRSLIVLTFLVQATFLIFPNDNGASQNWIYAVDCGCCVVLGMSLFKRCRVLISQFWSAVNSVVSLGMFRRVLQRRVDKTLPLITDPVFVPGSVPHLNGMFLFACSIWWLLTQLNPGSDMQAPAMPIPIPVELPSLFSYNWLGLMLLAICGAGIFVARKPKVVFIERLALCKINAAQLGIGLGLIVFSFAYDLAWSVFTHNTSGDLASKLMNYNAGTFGVVGGLTPSVVLAVMTAVCAGMGEETLIRGALQPVFGILPAAILHGVLHGQFAHAPIFMIQVAGWSAIMGIVKRYTNTTTTIIGHAGFNLVTTFLFAFNP